jgi:protein-tyrosine-phosphatase
MSMSGQIKTLFICTANACRSQMAEALLRHVAEGRFEAHSAGAFALGYIHPLAEAALERLGVPMAGQHSKSWDVYRDEPFDLVITLCASVAAGTCPDWTGAPIRMNWPLEDPVAFPGTDEERVAFAVQTAERLRERIRRLTELDFDGLGREELARRIERIGRD